MGLWHAVPAAELTENDIRAGSFVVSEIGGATARVYNVSSDKNGCELQVGVGVEEPIPQQVALDSDVFVDGPDEDGACE